MVCMQLEQSDLTIKVCQLESMRGLTVVNMFTVFQMMECFSCDIYILGEYNERKEKVVKKKVKVQSINLKSRSRKEA